MEAAFQGLRMYQEGCIIWSLAHNRSKINIFPNKHKKKKKKNSSITTAWPHTVVLAFPPTELNALNKHHPLGHPCY